MRFLAKAGNAHGLHSPFFYGLYTTIMRRGALADGGQRYAAIEVERNRLQGSKATIQIDDYGAGSHLERDKMRRVSAIAQHGMMERDWCQRVAALAQLQNCKTVVELGTSFGLTTAYLATALPQCNIHTFEGCGETLGIAKCVWERLGLKPTEHLGKIEETLPEYLLAKPRIDLAVIDANHTKEGVLAYYALLQPYLHSESVLVIDDIYWSGSMATGWAELKNMPEVRQSVDMYWQGWLFMKAGQAKEHFVLRP